MKLDFKLNESKVNQWLDELDEDRNKLYKEIRQDSEVDKLKEQRLSQLNNLIKMLLLYKKTLIKIENKE